ncbi:hypothetical protein F4818DRAFT_48046 [Hypoxylon cercidicola]|nr:hypothetical protein F4818DRAFT_48046 [Hypoxylon cercidicola]
MPRSTSSNPSNSSTKSSRFVWPFSLHNASKLDQYRLPTFVSESQGSSASRPSAQSSLKRKYINNKTESIDHPKGH